MIFYLMCISPLMTRTKQNSSKHRTILKLFWPKGASVNAGVKKNTCLGTYLKLCYHSLDDITTALRNENPRVMLYNIGTS